MHRIPAPPITIYDGGDLEVFPDVGTACASLESYDVDDLELFDSQGRRLQAQMHGPAVTGMQVVSDSYPVPDDLRAILRTFIIRVGPDAVGISNPETASLHEALESVLQFFQSGSTERADRVSWLTGLWKLPHGR